MPDDAPRRVLLKLSGGVFAAPQGTPFDADAIASIAAEVAAAHGTSARIAVVLGGGNVIRGARFCPDGPGRLSADYAGMLATALNGLVFGAALSEAGVPVSVYGAFAVPRMVRQFEAEQAAADLVAGRVVLLVGGTGNPFFTTDSAAALRAVELGAEVVLKATRVDGVYSADPEREPDAVLYDRLTYAEVLDRRLGVMDLTAISLCMEHSMPVRVFNYAVAGNIRRAVAGEPIGTLVGDPDDAR
jgi:uridylate kinase